MAEIPAPLIVVVAYNRPASISRLLDSLSRIRTTYEPDLLISIDNGGDDSDSVESIANAFSWKWNKSVIRHPSNLGLKEHVMQCASLANEHGSVIILEDDLIVAPSFYDKAVQLLGAYQDDSEVAGISLYTYPCNESTGVPFQPIAGSGDVHLMRQVSSWGQAWTARQWKGFTSWYEERKGSPVSRSLPKNIRNWPDTSWKKHFIDYVCSNELFIVYPNRSLTSNCGDPGTHFAHKYDQFRTDLELGNTPLKLPTLSDVDIRYGIYHELLPEVVKQFNVKLEDYSFDVDINGLRPEDSLTAPLVLTARTCRKPIFSFGNEYLPAELNVLLDMEGKSIHLAKKEDVLFSSGDKLQWYTKNDNTPRWVHDALGTPIKERLLMWTSTATAFKALNRLLYSVVRMLTR